MKKTLTFLVAVVVAGAASADIVQFKWGSGAVSDGVTAGESVLTYLDSNANGSIADYVVGGQIDINDLLLFQGGEYADMPATLVPFGPTAGQWGTDYMTDLSAAGSDAYAVTHLDFGTVGVGSSFLMSAPQSIIDLRPSGSGAALPPQDLVVGSMQTVEVVPEPATIGLMGIAGLGLFLARRKSRR